MSRYCNFVRVNNTLVCAMKKNYLGFFFVRADMAFATLWMIPVTFSPLGRGFFSCFFLLLLIQTLLQMVGCLIKKLKH